MVTEPEIKTRFEILAPFLNERTRRLAAAAEAAAIGRGGVSRVARATGVSRRAIASGLAELRAPDDLRSDRVRRAGGGRFPPGTSKWNKIEHRLFSFVSQNWRGKPLVSHETIVNLIAATTTRTGLKVTCELDRGVYPTGIKVSKKEMEGLNLRRDAFHGEWNYTISPRPQK